MYFYVSNFFIYKYAKYSVGTIFFLFVEDLKKQIDRYFDASKYLNNYSYIFLFELIHITHNMSCNHQKFLLLSIKQFIYHTCYIQVWQLQLGS